MAKGYPIPELMEVWRRLNIPAWHKVLEEATAKGQESRIRYAHWMLEVVLREGDDKPLCSPLEL